MALSSVASAPPQSLFACCSLPASFQCSSNYLSSSFAFSVAARPRKKLGAYSIGVVGDASIGISHFLKSSGVPGASSLITDRYSGWGYDNKRQRHQGLTPDAPLEAGRHHDLRVEYSGKSRILRCLVNDVLVHQMKATLDEFVLEIRLEAVGVDGQFEVLFEDLCYASLDGGGHDNLRKLGARPINIPR